MNQYDHADWAMHSFTKAALEKMQRNYVDSLAHLVSASLASTDPNVVRVASEVRYFERLVSILKGEKEHVFQ